MFHLQRKQLHQQRVSLTILSPSTVKHPYHGLVVHVYENLRPPQHVRVSPAELSQEMVEGVHLLLVDMLGQPV